MSANVAPNIIRSGLVFEYDFANPKSFPNAGYLLTDLSPNQISCSIVNPNPLSASFENNYMKFSPPDATGSGTYYITTDSRITSLTTEITLEAAVYVTNYFTLSGQPSIPISMRIVGGAQPIGFRVANGTITSDINTTTGWQNQTFICTESSLNKWIYVSQTVSDSVKEYKTYANAIIKDSRNYTGTPNACGGMQIGSAFYSGQIYFSGYVAFVRIYNRALSASEILQNYNALKGRFGLT